MSGGDRRRSLVRLAAVVARRDYLRTIRRRGYILGALLLPAGIGGFIALSGLWAPSFDLEPSLTAPLAVVNESAVSLTAPAGSDLRLVTRPQAASSLANGELREYYVIPAGYPAKPTVERVAAASRAALDDLQRHAQQERVLRTALRSSLLRDESIAPDVFARLLEPYELSEASPAGQPSPSVSPAAGFLVPYGFTLLFVLSIFITSGYLLQTVTEEKENRVVEILLSSVPPLALISGKIIGLGAAGLTQVAIWIVTALVALPLVGERFPILAGIDIDPLAVGLSLLFFMLGYLAYGAVFAAIGAISPGTREAQQYSGFFGLFAVIPLIFSATFLTDLQSPVVTILALIPLTAPAAMLQVLALSAAPPWPLVLASLTLLAAFAVLATVGATRIFRATVLLYGTRPGLRSILAAMTAR
jgi:ABC-2 type transport system permease protein